MSDAAGVPDAKHTSEMQVANIGFLIDRMGRDAHPLQFLRELTQNSVEAILETADRSGEIVWDVDWVSHELTMGEKVKLACIDTGTGMTGPEMVRYINQLSMSTREQAHDKNFGIGAKIAALTRNHEGLVYLSWKGGVGAMIHVWRDPDTGQYGIRRQERPDGTFAEWSPIRDDVKPTQIGEHGTMVILLGNSPEEQTIEPPEGAPSASVWIARYLNTRYFQFPEGIGVRARQGWKEPRSNTAVNLLRSVTGQHAYLDMHASAHGKVPLSRAVAHWWILKDESALTQNSGFIASSGHMAALFQDELYEMATSRSGVARLQMFGVIFGHQRVVIYVEPLADDNGGTLTSNAARTHLLLDGEPLPWSDWAAEFRDPSRFPEGIKELMEEVTAGKYASDHKQAIRDRLQQIRDLLKISRYRPTGRGSLSIAGDTPGGKPKENGSTRSDTPSRSGGAGGGRAGGVYALFIDDGGEPGDEVAADLDPDVEWITVAEGTRTPLVLEDRAAKYLPDQNLLLINGDFRVFTDMIERWESRYASVPSAHEVIREDVREWFEQALVETILGAQSLKNSPQWEMGDIAQLWSEEALTATVLQRYHIEMALRRALGTKLGSTKDSVVA